ncbi:uncharacterized protein LOC120625818 [Pararge aegeria]|uniref:Jg9499 protein n=1 Tax=Pararge aegeria aegeria TaxID=348720 RepID=A0A8S4RJN0_9NEOP|nr:uncharacterized protein LOC120625818 [Pararge aegeria]CAH2237007.1 jg9499 [Pararge aegeria aegeria]
MGRLIAVCLTLYVVLCYFQTQGADKYTDKNRPYEFGFTIDGEQHRHEKKDENGIIMGEFGFITADGVYHVTVYATDENGNFKIISMKNIRVKPYPTAPDSGERKGHSLSFQSPQQLTKPQSFAKTQQNKQESSSPLKSCSHCKIPTTTTTTPQPQLASSVVLSPKDNLQLPIAGNTKMVGNSQTFSQNDKNQQFSQHENSAARQQLSPSKLEQSYQQKSAPKQNNPNPSQVYRNEAVNFNNQEQYSQIIPSPQNNPQDDFNVGRKYLQKAQGQQNYQQKLSVEPISLVKSSAGLNNQLELNAGQQTQQGIFDGQYHLQPPFATGDDNQILNLPQSNQQQGGSRVQDFGATALGQSHQTNIEKSYIQESNTIGRNYQPKNTSAQETPGGRQPKTFMDILQRVNTEKQYNTGTTPTSFGSSQQNIGKPVLIAAQMQVVDKNTDIYNKNQGENDGLPKGLTQTDMTELLYTFNYTVGFHGHHEEGYKSGVKIGYYYVTARSGVRTRVDYIADEKGFHPRISQEILDVQSDEVPKPDTEKDEKYGLKGYEFKWLYYPVDSE